jgi:hypothetical protein
MFVARLVALGVLALPILAVGEVREPMLVGTWRHEDEEMINEVTYRADQTFRAITTHKKEFVTPSPLEETGTWKLRGNNLILDSTLTWNKERRRLSVTLLKLTRDVQLAKSLANANILSYHRLELPVCADSRSMSPRDSVPEKELIGSWRLHYNTHDYQFRFASNHRYSLLGQVSDKWDSLEEGSWRLKGANLFIKEEKNSVFRKPKPARKWTVVAVGKDCFAIRESSSAEFSLTRLK